MKPGQASRTAVWVCMGRALAHGRTSVARYSDPTAMVFLPEKARARVERLRSGALPRGLRQRLLRAYLERQSQAMVARTVEIDDAVRTAAAPQLVILGAGLDGRAWRMSELSDTVVFEVDHPDSQRQKRMLVGVLSQTAREVRYVPVDFTRDDLDRALTAAGHDLTRPTMWIWEGVVMYLTLADIEATLAIVARRSNPGSRLIVMYLTRSLLRFMVGWFVGLVGEPLRSSFTPEAMSTVLRRHGFRVERDQSVPEIGAALSAELGAATRSVGHARFATAIRTTV